MISVIVPVYNVDKYLNKCINSILGQTYKDFELILVNDGSTDNSPKICDMYARQYKNVQVIHKNNGGLSDARNVGTSIAKGEFITYIDSDDYVSKDYLLILSTLQKDNKADIVVSGFAVFNEGSKPIQNYDYKVYCYTKNQALEKMMYQDTLDTSACAMLLPAYVAKNNLFPLNKYHEDEFTTYKYYSSVERIVVTTQKLYFYLQRKGSIMHVFGDACIDELDAADNLVNFCKKNYPNLTTAAQSKKFSDYCQVLLMNTRLKIDHPLVYKRINNYLNGIKFQILKNKKCRFKNRVAAFLLIFGPWALEITKKLA